MDNKEHLSKSLKAVIDIMLATDTSDQRIKILLNLYDSIYSANKRQMRNIGREIFQLYDIIGLLFTTKPGNSKLEIEFDMLVRELLKVARDSIDLDYKEDIKELTIILERIIQLLELVKNYEWLQILKRLRADCDFVENAKESNDVRHKIKNLFRGTTGSFSEFYLNSGGIILPEDKEFDKLKNKLYNTAIRSYDRKEHNKNLKTMQE